jgi:hypothetical protein
MPGTFNGLLGAAHTFGVKMHCFQPWAKRLLALAFKLRMNGKLRRKFDCAKRM